jgi:hypothetical protein
VGAFKEAIASDGAKVTYDYDANHKLVRVTENGVITFPTQLATLAKSSSMVATASSTTLSIPLPIPGQAIPSLCTSGPVGAIACGGLGGYAIGSLVYPVLEPALSRIVDKCVNYLDDCVSQFEEDTKWCDNNFTGRKNFACHQWADNQLWRCKAGQPRLPFTL